ncbi:3-deoxy-7-phosphoheptulonate synthase, partial [Acinetobacter baumannii]
MNALNTLLTQSNTKETPVSLPVQLKAKYPLVQTFARQIAEHRQIIQNILAGKDQRLMVITGPCSIHDPVAVLEYADRLQKLQEKVKDQIFIVMRAYLEKPRTTVGWKGFMYDPNLDGSSNLQLGLEKSRELYLQIIEKGLP